MYKSYFIIYFTLIAINTSAQNINLGSVCTEVVIDYIETNNITLGQEITWNGIEGDRFLRTIGDGTSRTDFFVNHSESGYGLLTIQDSDILKIVGTSVGYDEASTLTSSNCGEHPMVDINVVQTSPPTLCTAEALQNIEDQGDLEINTNYEYLLAGDVAFFLGPGGSVSCFVNDVLQDPGTGGVTVFLLQSDLVRFEGFSIGETQIATIGGTLGYPICDMDVDENITVVQTSPPTLCTADALQNIEDQGGIEINDFYEYILAGDDAIVWGGNGSLSLFVNGSSQPVGLVDANSGDLIRIEGVSLGLEDFDVLSGSFGYTPCDMDVDGDITIVQTNPPTLCTEQVIDSLESGSPFFVGESIEWIALGEDNIGFEWLDGNSDLDIFVNDNIYSSFATYFQGDHLKIVFTSSGFEGAESTSSATCNPSTLAIFEIQAALPVTWSKSTKATIIKDKTTLTFSTAQQINNSHFEIEHSNDAKVFTNIGSIKGEGNSSQEIDYEYIHDNPALGVNYYRVKQVDLDGQYEYSNVASVRYESEEEVKIYPNPANDVLYILTGKDIAFTINDLQGMELIKGSTKSSSEINLDTLQKGVYFIKFSDGSVERFVKL